MNNCNCRGPLHHHHHHHHLCPPIPIHIQPLNQPKSKWRALMWLDGACCYCLYQGLSLPNLHLHLHLHLHLTAYLHHNPPPHTSWCIIKVILYPCACYSKLPFSFPPLFLLSFSFLVFSSGLLSTARLSLIRMMDGAELWLQPSPAASWELRDTEGEVGRSVSGRGCWGEEGGCLLTLCCPLDCKIKQYYTSRVPPLPHDHRTRSDDFSLWVLFRGKFLNPQKIM